MECENLAQKPKAVIPSKKKKKKNSPDVTSEVDLISVRAELTC